MVGLRRIEAMTLDGEWTDVTGACAGDAIPAEVVRAWSRRTHRTLVDFRLSM